MFSPDEEARLKKKFRLPADLKRGADKLDSQPRDISDIAGKHVLHFSGSPASRKELAQRLTTKLKFKVDTTGDDWLTTGNFDR